MEDSPVRPLRDLLIVKMEELPKPKEGAFWVPPSEEERVRTGHILETGPGRLSKKGKLIPMVAKPGMRIAFFRENFETQQGKQVAGVLGQLDKDIGILQERDILWEIVGD
jgi:co-chaperonin GroES (HSP10)